MLMSKHHYAIELGIAGNKVYFINHPDLRKKFSKGEVKVEPTTSDNVWAVSHRLVHPYFFKFKLNWLYNFFIRLHIKKIIRKIGAEPNIVWSFDTGNSLPLGYFPSSALKMLMPVDGPFGHIFERQAADKADVIVSVTDQILKAFQEFDKPKLLVNHGVAEVFLNGQPPVKDESSIRIGYSGSLVRNDLDVNCFLQIIRSHPGKFFEFWGEHDMNKSNIHLPQDVSDRTLRFLETLHSLPNVIMHGPVSSRILAEGIKKMDCLLICYNIKNDQNHHKVLEYLGTGKVIVSNFMSSYKHEDRDLIAMATKPDNNDELPALFDHVINNLEQFNSAEKQAKRKAFARQYSYSSNIRRIEEFVNANLNDIAEV